MFFGIITATVETKTGTDEKISFAFPQVIFRGARRFLLSSTF